MNPNYEQIKRLIRECDNEDCLEKVLDKLASTNPRMTKEEAIIRLLIDLPKS